MKYLTKDARDFVENVAKYIRSGGSSRILATKATNMLAKISDREKDQNRAKVESAVKLTEDEISEITGTVRRITGKDITVETSVNSDLIGGIRITVGDWVLDNSLKKLLDDLKTALI